MLIDFIYVVQRLEVTDGRCSLVNGKRLYTSAEGRMQRLIRKPL